MFNSKLLGGIVAVIFLLAMPLVLAQSEILNVQHEQNVYDGDVLKISAVFESYSEPGQVHRLYQPEGVGLYDNEELIHKPSHNFVKV